MLDREKVKKWFDDQYVEWAKNVEWVKGQPRPKRSFTAFAKWLGVSRNTLNNWTLRGQEPSEEMLVLVAAKLGNGVYDAVGKTPRDPELQKIIGVWERLSPQRKLEMVHLAEDGEGRDGHAPAPKVRPRLAKSK